MHSLSLKDFKYALMLGFATFLFYLLFSWNLPITDTVESNYALTAVEMIRNHDYLSPMIYGNYWYDKPIFTYWMLIASFKLFGVSDLAARLPSILTSALSTMAMYIGLYRVTGKRFMGMIGGLTLALSVEFWYIGHAVLTDGYLLLFSMGIFFGAYEGFTHNHKRAMVFAYVCSGLAVLTKGPVGLVLPGIILFVYAIWYRLSLKKLFPWQGILLFLVVVLPWYLYMYSVHGMSFVNEFLGLHNLTRATVPEHPTRNWWYMYLVILPVGLLPWTGFAVAALFKGEQNALRNLSLYWAIGTIIFYSLMATKYLTYTYISLIGLAVLTAQGAQYFYDQYREGKMPWTTWTGLHLSSWILWFGAGIAAYVFVPDLRYMDSLIIGMAAAVGGLLTSVKKRTMQAVIVSIVIGSVAFYAGLIYALPQVVNKESGRGVAQEIQLMEQQGLVTKDAQVYFYGMYRTSLTYYLGKVVTYMPSNRPKSEWDMEKDIMPTMRWREVLNDNQDAKDMIVCVGIKDTAHFEKSGLYKQMKLYKTVDNINIYIGKGE